RGAFDRIVHAGRFITVRTGSAPEANSIPVPKWDADLAMDAAACIGCGACVAACPNASAMLFVAAKVSHLGLLPQGQPERSTRVVNLVAQMDAEGFGACTNHGECMAACPKEISIDFIARLNRDYLKAVVSRPSSVVRERAGGGVVGGAGLEIAHDLGPAVAGALDDPVERRLVEELGDGDSGDRGVRDERHHGVAVTAQYHRLDVLDRDVERLGEKRAI